VEILLSALAEARTGLENEGAVLILKRCLAVDNGVDSQQYIIRFAISVC